MNQMMMAMLGMTTGRSLCTRYGGWVYPLVAFENLEKQSMELGKLPENEPFWVLCTEGEAVLIAGDAERSADFYEQALSRLSDRNVGMVQSSYNQLCRLYQVLGKEAVAPVVKLFIDSGFDLEPGPWATVDMHKQTGSVRRI